MKVIHCLAAGIAFSALASLASGVSAVDRSAGIKMLTAAATASRHHRLLPNSSAASGVDAPRSGIDKLIAAATASRHLRPLGSGPHAAKDAASSSDDASATGDVLQDLASVPNMTKGGAAPKALPGPGPGAAIGAATNGPAVLAAGISGRAGSAWRRMLQGAPFGIAAGFANANPGVNAAAGAARGPSALRVSASSLNRGGISGTGMGPPTSAAIGSATPISRRVASLNGSAVRSKR